MPTFQPRIDQLTRVFDTIAQTRMHGMPVLNSALRVESVGFALAPVAEAATPPVLEGILITPWFMNLLRLPVVGVADVSVGTRQRYRFGAERFDFIAAYEPALGQFEVCSLFSPMFEFADHAAAVATAHEVLRTLRSAPPPAVTPVARADAAQPGRRSFLFGRSSATAASGAAPR